MLQDLEFYVCLVFAALMVIFFLLFMMRFMLHIRLGVNVGVVWLVLIVFAAGLITGPWLYSFVSLYSPR